MMNDDDDDCKIHNWSTIPIYQSFRKGITPDMLHGACVHGVDIGNIKSIVPKEFRKRGTVMFDRSYILAYLNNSVGNFNCLFDESIVDQLAKGLDDRSMGATFAERMPTVLSVTENHSLATPIAKPIDTDLLVSIANILERFQLANSNSTTERNKKAYELIRAIEAVLPERTRIAAKGKAISDRLNGKNV